MILNKFIVICLGLLGVLGGFYFSFKNHSEESNATTLATLQELKLPDIEKNIRTGNEWLGKIVVVNHWATWCAPCREEIPMLIEFQNQMKSQDVQVVGIAHDLLDAARIFSDEIGINYPNMLAIANGNELLSSHGNNKGGALPYTVIFDRDGKIAHKHLGKLLLTDLNSMVLPLL